MGNFEDIKNAICTVLTILSFLLGITALRCIRQISEFSRNNYFFTIKIKHEIPITICSRYVKKNAMQCSHNFQICDTLRKACGPLDAYETLKGCFLPTETNVKSSIQKLKTGEHLCLTTTSRSDCSDKTFHTDPLTG